MLYLMHMCAKHLHFLYTFSWRESKQFGNSKQGVTKKRLGMKVTVGQVLQVRWVNEVWNRSQGAGVQPFFRWQWQQQQGFVVTISLSPAGTIGKWQSLCVRSLYLVWLELILQCNLVLMLGLFFRSLRKLVNGTGQNHGSSLPTD